jgi:hypothetical protein
MRRQNGWFFFWPSLLRCLLSIVYSITMCIWRCCYLLDVIPIRTSRYHTHSINFTFLLLCCAVLHFAMLSPQVLCVSPFHPLRPLTTFGPHAIIPVTGPSNLLSSSRQALPSLVFHLAFHTSGNQVPLVDPSSRWGPSHPPTSNWLTLSIVPALGLN